MVNSYFLHGYNDDLKFIHLDCCERMNQYLTGKIYEVISLKEINNPELKKEENISKYMRAISDFMKVKIELADLSSLLTGNNKQYSNKENYLTYYVDYSGCSSKKMIATHNLIRYLWYDNHSPMINIVLFLYENKNIDIPVEDIFGIAHSFQTSNNRALTGGLHNSKEGFIYFPDQKESLVKLQNGMEYFNNIYYERNIEIIIGFSIRGNFFEEEGEPVYFTSKPSFSLILHNLDSDNNKIIYDVCNTYIKYKKDYFTLSKDFNLNSSNKYKFFHKIIANIDSDKTTYITTVRNVINGREETFQFSDIRDVLNKIKELTVN